MEASKDTTYLRESSLPFGDFFVLFYFKDTPEFSIPRGNMQMNNIFPESFPIFFPLCCDPVYNKPEISAFILSSPGGGSAVDQSRCLCSGLLLFEIKIGYFNSRNVNNQGF